MIAVHSVVPFLQRNRTPQHLLGFLQLIVVEVVPPEVGKVVGYKGMALLEDMDKYAQSGK